MTTFYTIGWMVTALMSAVGGSAIAYSIVAVGVSVEWLGTGKHISRPLIRSIGFGSMWATYVGLAVALLASILTGPNIARLALSLSFNAWLLDDFFFGDRPRKKWLRSWAKAKLRAMKPVMKRAAQRWKPVKNPLPIPT